MKLMIVLGDPVSTNHLYRSGYSKNRKGIMRFTTTEGRAWKNKIRDIYFMSNPGPLLDKQLYVFVQYFFKDKRRRDVTNYDKAILDALNKVAWVDDSQIVHFSAWKFKSGCPKTIIHIFDIGEKDEIIKKFTELLNDADFRDDYSDRMSEYETESVLHSGKH